MYFVDETRCDGCNQCLLVCEPDVIVVERRKARILTGCVDCRACVKVCHVDAISKLNVPPAEGSLVCHACPVLCTVEPGRKGACQNFVNQEGDLIRTISVVTYEEINDALSYDYDEAIRRPLLTGIGAGTTAPCYRPSPYIVQGKVRGVDVVTGVTECIFSLCELYVKVDTDEHLGPEGSPVIYRGNRIGFVTTPGYGAQNLSLGGPIVISGTNTLESFSAVKVISELARRKPVTLRVDKQTRMVLQLGKPPIINGVKRERMKFACGSATLNLLSSFFHGVADEVVAIDNVYTGLYTDLAFVQRDQGVPRSGLTLTYAKNTPGRYYGVSGTGWGETNITDPLTLLKVEDPDKMKPGFTVLVTEPTGTRAKMYRYNERGEFEEMPLTAQARRAIEIVKENTEPTMVSALFIGGAGGSARGGMSKFPLKLTQAAHDMKVRITAAGVPGYILPGGGITFMVDVGRVHPAAFSWVPSPAVTVAMEYTMKLDDFVALGGHKEAVRPLEEVLAGIARGERFKVLPTGW